MSIGNRCKQNQISITNRSFGMESLMMARLFMAAMVALSFVFGLNPAAATLLFSGGEDVDFICRPSGSCSANTSTTFRSPWARESYTVGSSTADPPPNRFATSVLTASSTLWTHAQYCVSSGSGCFNNNTDNNAQLLRVIDSNGYPTLIVRGTGTNGQLKISSRTSGGAFTDLVTCASAFAPYSVTQLDLYVDYGASGQVTLYSNSVQVCTYTGNVTNGDGATTLNQVEFGASSSIGAWSEVIVATTDTRAMARFTANTVANGNAVGFSGTNVCSAIWSATTNNDANYGYSGSNNVVHVCTIRSSIPAGVYNVVALVMSARTLVGSTGPQHFNFVTRVGGTDYFSSDFAPTTSFSNTINYIQTANPATSNPWAISDFQAAGFNVGEQTKP